MVNGVGAILTVMERTFWTDCPFESCNVNSLGVVPVAVGVPAIFPVDVFKVSPLGNAGVTLQVYGGVPPLGASVMS